MDKRTCTYQGDRAGALIGYLYDDGDAAERAVFDAHVARCPACRAEIAELKAIRSELGRWTPPEPARSFTFAPPTSSLAPPPRSVWAKLAEIPGWAQVAAAVLVVGVAAGIANLEVRYDRDGLIVRTGWSAFAPADAGASARQVRSAPGDAGASARQAGSAPADASAQLAPVKPWQSDLTALEAQLRTEFRTATAAPRPASAGNDEILRRVRATVEESERRQQRELALRVGELLRDVQAQRNADLVRIDRTLGYIQNDTGTEVMRQRRLLNDLAVRVSQRQQ
jgi:anti-sigma factor RsiW